MFPPGIEPGTFRVLGGCDNHYTTETLEDVGPDKLFCVLLITRFVCHIYQFYLEAIQASVERSYIVPTRLAVIV